MDNSFYRCDEVMKILNVKKSKAYEVINELNKELESKGYSTIQGRVSKKYFNERILNK